MFSAQIEHYKACICEQTKSEINCSYGCARAGDTERDRSPAMLPRSQHYDGTYLLKLQQTIRLKSA